MPFFEKASFFDLTEFTCFFFSDVMDILRFRPDLRLMRFFLTFLNIFPLCRDFNHSPMDRELDLRFSEILSLKSFPEPQPSNVKDAKYVTTGAIFF